MPPKKKSAKKDPKPPKAPVGRPRKNLGTRVSDLPLVSIVKPTTRRINVDSLAMNRARMAYKRDYGKVLDERTARALIDAMSTTKRGPIGTSVVGTIKGKDVKFDLPGGISVKESSGFVDYYKQAKKALDENPKQKVKVKFKDDGSYTFTTPGIPATTSSRLDSSSVPDGTKKSISIQADIKSVGQILYAKLSGLTRWAQSGRLDDQALALANDKMDEYREKIARLIGSLDIPDLSPNNETTNLILERQRQADLVTNPNGTEAQRRRAQERVDDLDRQIAESLFASTPESSASSSRASSRRGSESSLLSVPASEEDIMAAVLGESSKSGSRKSSASSQSSSQSRPSAPAPAAAVEALAEALADPAVAAVVEQAQENAPVSTKTAKDIYLSKANMQKIAKEKKRLEELAEQKAIRDRGQARLKEERAKDAEL